MQRINALRNTYSDYRNELASLEKRAKRIKRKNRGIVLEIKTNNQ